MTPEHIIVFGAILFVSSVVTFIAKIAYQDAVVIRKWYQDYEAELSRQRRRHRRKIDALERKEVRRQHARSQRPTH
jgi:hypothetical protein